MDNYLQIMEIKKYQHLLHESTGKEVDVEFAAILWIRKFARKWRSEHDRNYFAASRIQNEA
ncbi:MAG: hypothetical protein JXA71_13945 [Chitinispirillaceae bacterium]|nr:hypothetical protein [Chitinispirillaceae bacterium]